MKRTKEHGSVEIKKACWVLCGKSISREDGNYQIQGPKYEANQQWGNQDKDVAERRAFWSEGIRTPSCHLGCGAVVVGCVNAIDRGVAGEEGWWTGSHYCGTAQTGPCTRLCEDGLSNKFRSKDNRSWKKRDVMVSLNTDNWAVTWGKSSSDGQQLIDEDCLWKLDFLDAPISRLWKNNFWLQASKDPQQE